MHKLSGMWQARPVPPDKSWSETLQLDLTDFEEKKLYYYMASSILCLTYYNEYNVWKCIFSVVTVKIKTDLGLSQRYRDFFNSQSL